MHFLYGTDKFSLHSEIESDVQSKILTLFTLAQKVTATNCKPELRVMSKFFIETLFPELATEIFSNLSKPVSCTPLSLTRNVT